MKLYLVRHGQAVSSDTDPARPLSRQGGADVRKVAQFIKPLHLRVEYIWHSGKLRAEQTAGILAEVVECKHGCQARSGLKPNDSAQDLAAELGAYDADVMLVGHLPFMADFASLLAAGRETADVVDFPAGAVACLNRRDPGNWQIEWLLSPPLLAM